MSFQPTIPLTGIPGWKFLERTQAKQQAAFENSPQIKRDIAYFAANIGKVTSAAELVADRRLLNVALTAFGLEGELSKKAYIRKALEGGTEDPLSLANRVTAPGMKQLVETFGFGNAIGAQTGTRGFADKLIAAYKTRAFESAVGNADNNMRLAMNFRREFEELSTTSLRKAFDEVPEIKGDVEYFTSKIGTIRTPEALVADTRLLSVALTAFGLENELANPARIRDMLAGGVANRDAPANRSGSADMQAFVRAFGFGQTNGAPTALTAAPGFAATIANQFKSNVFDKMIADANNKIPQAMQFKREVEALSKDDLGSWFSVLVSKPMRAVFEKAYSLPKEFQSIDIDQQRATLIDRTQRLFGTNDLKTFSDPANVEKMIVRFLVRAQIDESASMSRGAMALSLIQNLRSGSSQGLSNLLASGS